MKYKFKTNILVRDKHVQEMQDVGIRVDFEKLDKTRYVEELRRKLMEEAKEAAEEFDHEKVIFELADLSEVIQALASALNISQEQIEKAREIKKQKSGGFAQGLFTNFVEIDADNPAAEYYLARSEKYPRV